MSNALELLTDEKLKSLFPSSRADDFFEALFGGAEEGSYDIDLVFTGESGDELNFEFRLKQRPGKCLACNLTYGLPQVFSRHPVINVKGVVEDVCEILGKDSPAEWNLGTTTELSRQLHAIPLVIRF
ncbi:hypothetical protein [Maridesulfovibrio bastinii]|uniref:hypothetical protein n=1 Tax=Maridesulfovibrio bastinii TaxID=47157 RepID=UPI0003F5263E|nr:hypothetical protein [Maridesulfovibrio bastinii]